MSKLKTKLLEFLFLAFGPGIVLTFITSINYVYLWFIIVFVVMLLYLLSYFRGK